MAKPRKFPRHIQKFFIITKILKECDFDSRESILSVVIDPRLETESNHANVESVNLFSSINLRFNFKTNHHKLSYFQL